jgi:hypothetical protein
MKVEYDLRCSLLGYFSQQTIAHAALVLTIALIATALLQAKGTLPPVVFDIVLSGLIFLGVRTFGRTLYWGWLADGIINAPRSKGFETAEKVRKEEQGGFIDYDLETKILVFAAGDFVQYYHKWVSEMFSTLVPPRRRWKAVFIAVFLIPWFVMMFLDGTLSMVVLAMMSVLRL